MQRILNGAASFRSTVFQKNREYFRKLADKKQTPIALFITCSDSRVHPNLITQTEPGDLFLLRNAGNIVPPHGTVVGGEAATIEYAVEVLKIAHIIICGHSECGAMRALIASEGLDDLPAVKAWCNHAESTRRIVAQKYQKLPKAQRERAAIEQNVLVQLNNLSTHPSVAAKLATGEVQTYGWFYDIGEGQISQYDDTLKQFKDLGAEAVAHNPMPLRSATMDEPVRNRSV